MIIIIQFNRLYCLNNKNNKDNIFYFFIFFKLVSNLVSDQIFRDKVINRYKDFEKDEH